MRKSGTARRVPRKVGQDEEDLPAGTEGEGVAEPTLKRPSAKPRKKSSTLRKSYGPSAIDHEDDSDPAGVVTPKRGGLSKIAVQRNASKRTSLLGAKLPTRQDDDGDDSLPSYSAASLQELKNSTPTTPRDLTTDTSNSAVEDVEKSTQALDLSSKFGSSLSRYQQPSAIPSAAEIEEKKARRSRLAKEQAAEEFISLDPDDPGLDDDEDNNVTRDDVGRLILKPKDKYDNTESRLVRDDEDVMENFEEFTEADGKILLGRKAEREEARKRKVDMAARIAEAEGSNSDPDSDASEKDRNNAFEAAQSRHGTYAAENATPTDTRPRTPPQISPLPTLDGALERLRRQVVEAQAKRMQMVREAEALRQEKVRLGEEEVRIQKLVKETGEKFAALRAERGIEGPVQAEEVNMLQAGEMGPGLGYQSGDAEPEDEDMPHAGLGMSMAPRGFESLDASDPNTPGSSSDGMVT